MQQRPAVYQRSKYPVIRMLNELRGRVDELNGNFSEEIRNIKIELENKKRTIQK